MKVFTQLIEYFQSAGATFEEAWQEAEFLVDTYQWLQDFNLPI